MKQNLFKSFCPICKEKAQNFIGEWINVINSKQLPKNLVEESCPACANEIAKKIRLRSPVVVI